MTEYIKREDVLRAYEEEQRRPGPYRFETLIESVPSADVALVRHGRWLPTTKWWQGGSAWKQCSECGILHCGKSNFCPNCGVKMDGVDDE